PHLKIEEVEVGRAHDRADRGHRLGCVHGSVAERRKLPLTVFRFGGIELDRGREHALQAFVGYRVRLAVLERVIHRRAKRRAALGAGDVIRGRGWTHADLTRARPAALIRAGRRPGALSRPTLPAAPRARTAARR